MATELRTRFLSAFVFIVLIASAAFTVPARADSGSPPAPPAPSGTTSTSSNTPQNVTQVPSAVANISAGNNTGHKVNLGSQKAAYTVLPGDPIWCPSAVAVPVPSAAGCTSSQTNLYNLISEINLHHTVVPNTNGTIWIAGGADLSPSMIIMNGTNVNFNNWKNFSLLFKGGWNGLGTGSVNTAIPSTFSQEIQVLNWNNNVTLTDIYTNNVASGEGLEITTSMNISLTRVHADNNSGNGAYLSTNSGTGSVTITNSEFNGDAPSFDPDSIEIHSHNAITLTNVIADNGKGAHLDNSGGSNVPITIKSSNFDNNSNAGLTVISRGAITIKDISASGNTGVSSYGASLANDTGTAAPVTLTGTNIFDSNAGYGLLVTSAGKITSGSISANNNGGNGTKLDNSSAASALPITLTGTSSFTGNSSDGLYLTSRGAISANNLFVDDNGSVGAYINNNGLTSPVKLTGTNWFANNGGDGIFILSTGAIALNNVNANNNSAGGADGLFAFNAGALAPENITLTGINNFNGNAFSGVVLTASGAVSMSNVTASNNTGSTGIFIDNTILTSTKPQNVTLLGSVSLINNHADNLDISTYGAITLNNVTASGSVAGLGADLNYGSHTTGNVIMNGFNSFSDNSLNGLYIESKGTVLLNNMSAINNGGGMGVIVVNTASTTFSAVTLKGNNTFEENSVDGLSITSNGRITLNNLTATINDIGVNLVNTGSGFTHPQAVVLTGTNTFNNNNTDGLDIFSFGLVTASNLNADVNGHVSGDHGVYINNFTPGTAQNVTLTGTNIFDSNYGFGLSVISNGAITVGNLDASSNTHNDGADLLNFTGTAGVTLTGTHTFNHNFGIGLLITSRGPITASSLTATYNGNILSTYGVKLDNSASSTAAPITLTGTNTFSNNKSDGLRILSQGAITTNNLTAEHNNTAFGFSGTDAGVWLDNRTAPTPKSISMNGVNTFLNNTYEGLNVFSKGAITTNNLTANNNGAYGAWLQNDFSGAMGINVKGPNVFLHNTGGDGLELYSNGAVTVTHINANYNFNGGMFVNTIGQVTVICGSFIRNGTSGTGYGWETGFDVQNIKLIGVDSSGNNTDDHYSANPFTAVISTPRTCTLP